MENRAPASATIGVILMTYGSATTAENVKSYMKHIYGEKASPEVIADFEERYRLVGHSPLIEITKKQAALVEAALNNKHYIVRAGMLHSSPSIDETVEELVAEGIKEIHGVILSPQFSSYIMEGYKKALMAAALKRKVKEENVTVAGAWPTEPHFIKLLATRVEEAREKMRREYQTDVPVLFTTHSLPQRVVEKDPNYLQELQATIDAIVTEIADPSLEWRACYQSAGHTPEEWLKPDLTDVLAELGARGVPAVIIAPIQFLADHLEILYDLDIAAKAQCNEAGIAYHRIELPNTDPLFIKALATIVC